MPSSGVTPAEASREIGGDEDHRPKFDDPAKRQPQHPLDAGFIGSRTPHHAAGAHNVAKTPADLVSQMQPTNARSAGHQQTHK